MVTLALTPVEANGHGVARNFHRVTVNAELISDQMRRRGWHTSAELSREAGVSASTASEFLRGRPVSRAYAERVIAALLSRPELPQEQPAPAPAPAPARRGSSSREDDVDALVALTRSCLGDDPAALCDFVNRITAL